MTAGHFGFAAALKSPAPSVPLWALMLSTYLLDIVFIVLVAAGVENFAPLDPAHPGYGEVLIQAYYTHSLVGAALISIIAGVLAGRAWGARSGGVIGAVAFSHWLLDLLVHRPDLPILPGNFGNLPLLGLGLWNSPAVSAMVELGLTLAGTYLYYRSALGAPVPPAKVAEHRVRALVAVGTTGILILLLLLADVLNLPTTLPLVLMLLLIVLCGWLDSRLNWSLPAM